MLVFPFKQWHSAFSPKQVNQTCLSTWFTSLLWEEMQDISEAEFQKRQTEWKVILIKYEPCNKTMKKIKTEQNTQEECRQKSGLKWTEFPEK